MENEGASARGETVCGDLDCTRSGWRFSQGAVGGSRSAYGAAAGGIVGAEIGLGWREDVGDQMEGWAGCLLVHERDCGGDNRLWGAGAANPEDAVQVYTVGEDGFGGKIASYINPGADVAFAGALGEVGHGQGGAAGGAGAEDLRGAGYGEAAAKDRVQGGVAGVKAGGDEPW